MLTTIVIDKVDILKRHILEHSEVTVMYHSSWICHWAMNSMRLDSGTFHALY